MILVTITNYNKSLYIKRLLTSLNKQIDEDVKVILVDDASTDDSVEVIKAHPIYKQKNFELIVHKENTWVSQARNEGIKKLTENDWITFIDGDDFVEDNYIETLKAYIRDNRFDVYQFDYKDVPVDGSSGDDIEKAGNMMCWSRLYRGSFLIENQMLFKDIPYKEEGFGEDVAFEEELLGLGAKEKETGDIIYCYHWGVPDSLSNTYKETEQEETPEAK